VKPPQTSPSDIKHRIQQAFERAADLDAQTITVESKEGKVILRGTVDSWAERERAELAAWAAPGVSHVENEILVTSEQEIVTSL
jgi:osmotically-inducible protein OsmY